MEFGVVFVTCSQKQAKEIAKVVVKARLAACVNIISQVTSIYTWKEKIEEDHESLLIIKTRKDLFPQLEEKIKAVHSYDVPEIIWLPIQQGHQPYLNWISEVTT